MAETEVKVAGLSRISYSGFNFSEMNESPDAIHSQSCGLKYVQASASGVFGSGV